MIVFWVVFCIIHLIVSICIEIIKEIICFFVNVFFNNCKMSVTGDPLNRIDDGAIFIYCTSLEFTFKYLNSLCIRDFIKSF